MSVSVLYIVPPTRQYAGIERVVDEICEALATRHAGELDVTVLHLAKYADHDLGPRTYESRAYDARGRLEILGIVRREIARRRYDLVVVPQVEATVLFWLASVGLHRHFVLYLHGNPARENSHPKANILFFLFRRGIIHRLRAVFGTSPRQLLAFGLAFPSEVPRVWTPNPVRAFQPSGAGERVRAGINFVTVGRFCRQKGQDLLIDAFAAVHRARPGTRLTLVGYGAEQSELVERVRCLDLLDAVAFEHHPHDPQAALERADIYVSTSRWEGWSLAICEALRFGLPVVATDCEFGPSDILTDERLGTLVPPDDVGALAEAMIRYADALEEQSAHARFRMDYVARFDASNVVAVHASALLSAAGRTPSTRGEPSRGTAPADRPTSQIPDEPSVSSI